MSDAQWPDWRKPDGYPSPEISPHLKAWEFLRRNPDYRREYAQWAALPDVDADGKISGKWKGVPGELAHFYCAPPALPGEPYRDYIARMGRAGEADWVVMPYREYLERHYLIEPEPFDPDLSANDLLAETATTDLCLLPHIMNITQAPDLWHAGAFSHFVDRQTKRGPLDAHQAIVTFDLRLPIKQQTEIASRELTALQRDLQQLAIVEPAYHRAPGASLFVSYLRLLDGAAAGASTSEMATELLPDEDNTVASDYAARRKINQRLAAARDLCDRGYGVFTNALLEAATSE